MDDGKMHILLAYIELLTLFNRIYNICNDDGIIISTCVVNFLKYAKYI